MISLARKQKIFLILVQTITITRAIAALLFVSLALTPQYVGFATYLFLYACLSDLLDGFLARQTTCETETGGALDLFSDKYLTIISASYAIARGLPTFPCGLIILREIFLVTMRTIQVDQRPLLPPQRILGTFTVIPIWAATFVLLEYPRKFSFPWLFFESYYWFLGGLNFLNLAYKIKTNWKLIVRSLKT